MAGMFFSLKEAAERLGVTQEQVKQLAKDGKLREFRDGSNLLFKIEEVNALAAEGAELGAGDLELSDSSAEELPAELTEDTGAPSLDDSLEEDIFKLDEEAAPAAESAEETDATAEPAPEAQADELAELDLSAEAPADELAELDLTAGAQADELAELDLTPEAAPEGDASSEVDLAAEVPADASSELDLAPLDTAGADTTGEEEFSLAEEAPAAPGGAAETDEEISLAAESDVLAAESDITSMDTALTGEGVNVLGESDADLGITDDSMAETAGPAGTSAEASLEEIEEDVNLDSFGSGSGLLDLSLQADDTSLGGILDEIYTSEGGEEGKVAEDEGGEAASFEEITAEADHAAPEEETTEAAAVLPVMPVTPVYAEAVPDSQSNILGVLLFLPLLALLYTAIVTVAAMREVTPGILSSVQGLIWYVLGAGIVLTLIVVGASFVAGGEKAPRAPKPAKDKRAKVKKEKVKAAKPAKDAKPAKEKKSFFGKKK
jgi:excisionase family DNA binding protein